MLGLWKLLTIVKKNNHIFYQYGTDLVFYDSKEIFDLIQLIKDNEASTSQDWLVRYESARNDRGIRI